MYATYVQKGETIDFRPETPVAAGDIFFIGGIAAIAKLDIPAYNLGALSITGVFDIAKNGSSFEIGNDVYWDDTAHKATSTENANLLGKAVDSADSGDNTVRVLLNCAKATFSGGGGGSQITPASAIPNLTDNSGGTVSNTIPQLTDLGTRDAVAALAAKLNAVLGALRNTGIIQAS